MFNKPNRDKENYSFTWMFMKARLNTRNNGRNRQSYIKHLVLSFEISYVYVLDAC